MTTRHSGYLVVLERNLREDDAQPLLDAIRLLRGVESVVPVESEGYVQAIAEERVRAEFTESLLKVLRDRRGEP